MNEKKQDVQTYKNIISFTIAGLLALAPFEIQASNSSQSANTAGNAYVRFFYTDDERSASFDIDCLHLIRDPIVGTYLCTLISRSYKPILGQFSEDIFSMIEQRPQAFLDIQNEYLAEVDDVVNEFKNKVGIDPEVDAFINNFYQIIYAKNKTELMKALKIYRELRRGGEICSVVEGKNVFLAEVNNESRINGEFSRRGTKYSASFDHDGLDMRSNSPAFSGNTVSYDAKPGLASKPGCKRLVWW